MDDLILYSTGCPQCEALEQMLNTHGIKFEICTDKEKMVSMGLTHVPVLEVSGVLMNFRDAIKWIGEKV